MVCDSSCASPKQGNLEQRRTDYDGFGEKCVSWRVLCLASMRMSVVDGGGLRMCFSINFDVHFKYVDSIPVKTVLMFTLKHSMKKMKGQPPHENLQTTDQGAAS